MNIYQKAITAIHSHPNDFLHQLDFIAALQFLKDHNNDRPSMAEGHLIDACDPRKIALLPVPLDAEDDRYYFYWYMPRDEYGSEFVSLMFDTIGNLPETADETL